jgi:hypothetical protein
MYHTRPPDRIAHRYSESCIERLCSELEDAQDSLSAALVVVRAARLLRVRDWQRKRAHRQRSKAAIRDAQYRVEESVAGIFAATANYVGKDYRAAQNPEKFRAGS